MALSIWVPIGYIGALVLSLSLFSSIYRRRSAKNLAKESSEPWHPEGHPERDVYQSLISASASGAKIPDHVLKAALLNRAMTDVKRIVQMRDDKQALAVLIQKGSIGDETTARFALAEKELEAEILDVVSEANTFREGWGQMIFPTASEMATHFKHKEVYYGIPEARKAQEALLTAQGKPIPKATIELPPLFTPPGTQITVQQPQQQQGAQQQQPSSAGGSATPPGFAQLQPGQQPPPGAIPIQMPPQLAAEFAKLPPPMQQQFLQRLAMAQQAQRQQQEQQQGKQGTQSDSSAPTTTKATTVEEESGE